MPETNTGFSLLAPDDWVDLSIYSFSEPDETDPPVRLTITIDLSTTAASLQEFSQLKLDAVLKTASGASLLRKEEVPLEGSLNGVRAEVRWFPTDVQRLFQRYLFFLVGDTGYALFTQLTKKGRATLGPAMDRIMESFRPSPPGPGMEPPPKGMNRFPGGPFTIRIPPGWTDESLFLFSEPDESQFRRTVVVHRQALDGPPGSLRDVVGEEMKILAAASRDFELLEEGPVPVPGADSGYRCRIRLRTGKDTPVAQTLVFAIKDRMLYSLNLTAEAAPPPELQESLNGILASFSLRTS